MALLGLVDDDGDDPLDSLLLALSDPASATKMRGIEHISYVDQDPVRARGLIAGGAADWVVVLDSHQKPADIVVGPRFVSLAGPDQWDFTKGLSVPGISTHVPVSVVDVLRTTATATVDAAATKPSDGTVPVLAPQRGGLPAAFVSSASPDCGLWDFVPEAERAALATQMLRAEAGLPPTPALEAERLALERQRVEFEAQRVAYFATAVAASSEYVEQRKKWKELADTASAVLRWALIASAVLTAGVLLLAGLGKLDGWQSALIIFVLGVVAISPSVLLLLERPLAGVDAFQPPGPAGAASGPTSGKSDGGKSDDGKSKAKKPDAA
ncbi:hypothetical protein Xcel_2852 [Xylanimonas cellulosilytica DSM 15894]|uniref:Uncharacterized protein n=1 Tax=Xylanimonas cellulosilytica (strain DSM 15894 / JCM 12276 / CECT 5975 / KCTC 9989 / LMG 20990 / NBRC 107835 / XIL07) TaxID=446471 RepID=D1BYJ3_XYLCX|nr:hypothetical protein [Xylanimonas cellulosilytica]ACZ31865.1 hypothetical protein Xcel_2852 [Xylanimonas cellulosilytica DSM 15894]